MFTRNGVRASGIGAGFLSLFILAASGTAQTPRRIAAVRRLSAFEMVKAEQLLRDKLPCLGCHELGGEGGRIGPSLSGLKATRPPDYVFAMISDPQATVPGVVMPQVPLTRKYTWTKARFDFQLEREGVARVVPEGPSVVHTTLELIGNYLLQREPARESPPKLIPRPPPAPLDESADSATLYRHYCADCHGEEGKGDGPNGRFLPVQPVSHADAAYMSERPDDSLFDAIYSGGYIMNLSPRMPPYGSTLSREQIWSLVRYLRVLCDCQGPAWSRDGRR
ncbi:MAG: c-type cytochrome [Gemmatimonadales bacterium]|jgi:mono/diheme cytochrome c family protein